MSTSAAHPVLVTGGAGFIGCNLADALAHEGHHVLVFDSLARRGVERNLQWLQSRHPHHVETRIADLRDARALHDAAREASAVFHLAAQVAVTTSLQDPHADFAVNLQATVALLEALRRQGGHAPLIFASTNKVYGDLGDVPLAHRNGRYAPVDEALRTHGVDEGRGLDFHTPYGCSKGAADQYVLDYARSYGLPTAVLRMSCIYGTRQMGTEDQGWVTHFLLRARAGAPITLFGDGQQVRDVLDVADAVAAYVACWRNIDAVAGQAFNLGGGPDNAVSLLELLDELGAIFGDTPRLEFKDWRQGDQRWFVADMRRGNAALGLAAPRDWRSGLRALAAWCAKEGLPRTVAAA